MKLFKNNKKKMAGLAMLLAVTVAGGTFAWFTSHVEFQNEFETGKYETEITENFIPPTDWRPGMETDKSVFVENKGDVPVVVRVKFSDAWYEKEGNDPIAGLNIFEYTKEGSTFKEEAALKNFNELNVVKEAAQIVNGQKWYIRYEEENGVRIPKEAYFLKTLAEGEKTNEVLKSVTMNANISGEQKSEASDIVDDYGKVIGQKVVTTTDSPYADKRYELTITAEVVQADKAAVVESWADAFGENGYLAEVEKTNILAALNVK